MKAFTATGLVFPHIPMYTFPNVPAAVGALYEKLDSWSVAMYRTLNVLAVWSNLGKFSWNTRLTSAVSSKVLPKMPCVLTTDGSLGI